ncbi:MAG: LysR family transcriptional regulator [Firmicutes bacterium]|nr:LysR family transcriptional regulator [Bacillota bacterium]
MVQKNKQKNDGIYIKLFVNKNGETLLCRGRLSFIEAVDKCGSIAEAAKLMGYSYRKAWGLVEKTNRAAGKTIIETSSGGAAGGSARLTPEGRELVAKFKNYLKEAEAFAEKLWTDFNPL